MTTQRTELGVDNVAGYLEARGALPPDAAPSVRRLGGGVSNTVLAVSWDGGCLVVKQPLANLDVDDDWPADRSRVHNEAAAAHAFRRLLEDDTGRVRVPDVLFEDPDDHVIALACVPGEGRTWKAELLDGRVDSTVAVDLGHALAKVHRGAVGEEALRAAFDDPTPFDQLRLDPYHRTVAERYPELADRILEEADRVASAETTLVHGDFSPKNVLLEDAGGGAGTWLIDFEVAHWGDPAFDVAFLLNHLTIKALYVDDRREALLEAAEAFWDAYRDRVPWESEHAVVAELGVLVLARVDGKSPVEYVEEGPVADAMRRVGTRTLRGEVGDLEGYARIVREAGP